MRLLDEPRDRRPVEMADDLRQVEVRGRGVMHQVIDLPRRVGVGVRPAAELQTRLAHPNLAAQLPRVIDAPRPAERPIAAENDQRRKAVLPGLFGVAQTEIERMLRREKRDDALARQVATEIGDEMTQVVFFLRTDRAVGKEHRDVLARQRADGVIRVDPRVHAFGRSQLRARRPELRRDHRVS